MAFNTFHGCREDAYDSLGIRVIYEERKDDPDILGFIDIGLNADNAFNEYVADYAKNGYENEDASARQPGRQASPREMVTSYSRQISRISS